MELLIDSELVIDRNSDIQSSSRCVDRGYKVKSSHESTSSQVTSVKSRSRGNSRARWLHSTHRSRTYHASSKRYRSVEGGRTRPLSRCRTNYPNTRKQGTQGPQYPQPKRQEVWSTARSALTSAPSATRERRYRTHSRKRRSRKKRQRVHGDKHGRFWSALNYSTVHVASRDASRRRDDARVSEHRAAHLSSGYPHVPAVTAIILSWGAFGRAAKACGASWQPRRIGGGCKRT